MAEKKLGVLLMGYLTSYLGRGVAITGYNVSSLQVATMAFNVGRQRFLCCRFTVPVVYTQ